MTKLANNRMTDDEVDALPGVRFKATGARIKMREKWGWASGQKARQSDIPRSCNPFSRQPNMPMADFWLLGWKAADQTYLT